jgi:FkbM family methyltransferase
MSGQTPRPEWPIYHMVIQLWRGGMRFGSLIDVGCADGHFGVLLAEKGPLRDGVILNIDAQEDYRGSLHAIQQALGGHYAICALSDKDGGTVEITRGTHPYWSSLRPAGDPYWKSHNDQHGARVKVPRRTLDALIAELGLPGPYLVKLDIQGAEAAALRGAKRTLRNTEAVVVEVLIDDFAAIHQVLHDSGFVLFDMRQFSYTTINTLSSFDALYIAGRHRALLRQKTFDPAIGEQLIAAHEERRRSLQKHIAETLERFRAGRWPDVRGGS